MVKTSLKNYLVDCVATTTFYTPLLAASEYLSGMESDEVLKSRLIGMGFHFTIGRPFAWLRQKWANRWHVDASSSKMKKYVVDTSIFLMVNPSLYAGVLYTIGASLDESLLALGGASVIGLATGRPFGWWLDKTRTYAGTKTTL